MGIEKISASGAVPYQGSAAVPTVQTVEAPAQTSVPVQIVNQSTNTAGQGMPKKDFPIGKKDGEEAGRSEELGAKQGAQLKDAVNDLNRQMKNSEAIFGIHDKTNRVTIKIVDKATKEVIKEYPPEQTLDMIAKVWEVAGLMVDEKR